jgi:hypothetical protein
VSNTKTISLVVQGIGHVPSFKNSKMIARGRLITAPEKQEWMEKCIQSFESQLTSLCQMAATATQTEPSLPSWIASSVPADDSLKHIAEETVRPVLVPKGQEGAIIKIEPI